jgi:hypothetical protein
MNILYIDASHVDADVPVKRLKFSSATGQYSAVERNATKPFLRGPVSMEWLSAASSLPGKALQVALAIQWVAGMSAGRPFKLTGKALAMVHISVDAATDGVNRLEAAGLIALTRKPGQRPTIQLRAA